MWSKIKDFKRKEKFTRIIATINIKDNYIDRDICLEIRDNKEMPIIEKVDKVDRV